MSGSPENNRQAIYTIGHSDMALEYFIGLLQYHHIARLVDTRSDPHSKYADWFAKTAIEKALRKESIDYVYLGKWLGGRPNDQSVYKDGNVDFELPRNKDYFIEGIDKLVAMIDEAPLAIMCTEENPRFCHRSLAIAQSLEARGIEVLHIRHNGSLQPESLLRPQIKLPLF